MLTRNELQCLQNTRAKHHHLQQLAWCVRQLVQYIFILSMDRSPQTQKTAWNFSSPFTLHKFVVQNLNTGATFLEMKLSLAQLHLGLEKHSQADTTQVYVGRPNKLQQVESVSWNILHSQMFCSPLAGYQKVMLDYSVHQFHIIQKSFSGEFSLQAEQ